VGIAVIWRQWPDWLVVQTPRTSMRRPFSIKDLMGDVYHMHSKMAEGVQRGLILRYWLRVIIGSACLSINGVLCTTGMKRRTQTTRQTSSIGCTQRRGKTYSRRDTTSWVICNREARPRPLTATLAPKWLLKRWTG